MCRTEGIRTLTTEWLLDFKSKASSSSATIPISEHLIKLYINISVLIKLTTIKLIKNDYFVLNQ